MTRFALIRAMAPVVLIPALIMVPNAPADAGQRRSASRHTAEPARTKTKSARIAGTRITGASIAGAKSATARPERDKAIEMLAPETRLEQRCNARAMGAISREHPDFAPDELVAYAFADPDTDIDADTIKAPGAAVRSKGHWYHLAYRCQTTADGLDVVTFSYALGEVVPRGDWDAHYLVP